MKREIPRLEPETSRGTVRALPPEVYAARESLSGSRSTKKGLMKDKSQTVALGLKGIGMMSLLAFYVPTRTR